MQNKSVKSYHIFLFESNLKLDKIEYG